ncbi:MAG TPA: septum formation initiator family protein [Candidatus Acidoferrales bacterium]|nr:septum formation initiator family protein [Candidatus Acidoferrales bacterium]
MALVLFVIAAVWGDHGLVHLLHLRSEQADLEHTAFELQQSNEHMRQRIRRLESDDWYVEKLARERLGMVKSGEIVYRVAAPTPAAGLP